MFRIRLLYQRATVYLFELFETLAQHVVNAYEAVEDFAAIDETIRA